MGKRHQRKSQHQVVDVTKLQAIVERAKAALSEEEHATLKASLETLAFLQQELKAKGASIERLRQIVFGAKTEKTSALFPNKAGPGTTGGKPAGGEGGTQGKTVSYTHLTLPTNREV